MTRALLAALWLLCISVSPARGQGEPGTRNVFLITVDGLRWQELFAGADSALLTTRRFVQDTASARQRYWAPTAEQRRRLLFPFFWGTLGTRGQVYGNRALGSRVDLTNPHHFSYPGYNEILTGYADPRISSNQKRENPNRTLLEVVSRQPGFQGRVAVFASWDVFPYILREGRSGIPVNAGFEPVSGRELSPRERFLNELLPRVPTPSAASRLDIFTHLYGMEYLRRNRPRLFYLGYNDSDEFAHEGKYDSYLESLQRVDEYIREVWQWIQSTEGYRDRTTLVITTDHGRGTGEQWTGHGVRYPGAHETWIAVIGPDTPPLSEREAAGQFHTSQIAATIARLLRVEYRGEQPIGAPLERVVR